MTAELTFRSGRTLPTRVQSSGSETLLRIRCSAACTIGTLESSIRKRHDDFDVLAEGVVVGRIFKARATPVGASMLRRARRRWRGSRKAGSESEAFLTLRLKQAKIDGL
jgi:hypothetical protein